MKRTRLLSILLAAAVLAAPHIAAAQIVPNYLLQWGGPGVGNGQFSQPSGVAADGTGNIYVTDTGNNRVQKFDGQGNYLTSWGGPGSGPGQFNAPFGIAVNGSQVFVVDSGNNRVQVFNLSGVYQSSFGSPGAGPGQFQQARCIAIDTGSGDVFVTDFATDRVERFDGAGNFILQWGGTGNAPGQFSGPSGIAIGGSAFVTDSGNNRVEAFDLSGNFQLQFGVPGNGNGQLSVPLGATSDAGYLYVADTGNHRMQIFNGAFGYSGQWGTQGGGNGQFQLPRASVLVAGTYVYVADTGNNRIQKFGPPSDGQCAACASPPDTCCEAVPQIGGPWNNIIVGTREPSISYPYAVSIFNLNSPPVPAENTNWASMVRYNGPGNTWLGDSLGTVFGLTLDKYGNIFVTHTSCYASDRIGQVFGGAPGAIYRIDAVTGAIRTFCVLPNTADPAVAPGENFPGLGNITYDCRHEQFFVTDLDDGRIYRVQPAGVNGPTGNAVESFDPMAPDNGLPGWAPLGERLWGVQWHGDRVYYGVWAEDGSNIVNYNEIRSVALTPAGAFIPGSDQHELWIVPPIGNFPTSYPAADISFSATGKMLLGERGITNLTSPNPHAARVLEFSCSGGCWVPANTYNTGVVPPLMNAEGGVDYDRHTFGGPSSAIGRVWATSDAMHLPPYFGTDYVYGYQGLRPNLASGSVATSMLIDSDGPVLNYDDKMFIGDVEAPGCPVPEFGTICGEKFKDSNHNGVKDPGEPGLSGWTIQLNGPGGPYIAITDANGNFCISAGAGTYVLSEIGQTGWVQTKPAGGTYNITLALGQTLTGYQFGNYACVFGPPCITPPIGIVGWWPFHGGTGVTTTKDVTHLSPPRNVAELHGNATFGTGEVETALCLPQATDFAVVPKSQQLGLDLGTGSFSIDAWVNPELRSAGPRVIVEKRLKVLSAPYRTRGWALYLMAQQAFLEIGTGTDTQIIPGPQLADGVWSHLAVSVDRSNGVGRWYLNGATSTTVPDFTPISGSVDNTEDVYIGQANPNMGVNGALTGCIDELDVLSTPITAAKAASIFNGGIVGKCPEYLSVPSVKSICAGLNTVTICFNICNNKPTAQSYTWSIAGLPIGPGCTVAGPTIFSPASGTVTVNPGTCSLPICVTITRPSGLTAQNATSCYSVTMVNDSTGVCRSAQGAIRADNTCWCVTPVSANIVSVQARLAATTIGIGIKNPCDPPSQIAYQLIPVWQGTDQPDPHAISLNGLPPGQPVTGMATVPGHGSQQVDVDVRYVNGYDAFAPYEIVMDADTDVDGIPERVAVTRVRAIYDSTQILAAPDDRGAIEMVRLVARPNPFLGGSSIGFTLGRTDDVTLGVYDLSGRLVRSLQRGRLAAGAHRFDWNGRDDGGRKTAAGVYFVRLDATGQRQEAKLVKLQ